MTPKQKRFVEEYLKDLNGKDAAIRAGFKRNSAKVTACKMLKNPAIIEEINLAIKARSERVEITQDSVIKEVAKIAFKESYHDPAMLNCKLKALALLGKHLGTFVERTDVTHRIERPLKNVPDEELYARLQA